jgi:hypothetical protein
MEVLNEKRSGLVEKSNPSPPEVSGLPEGEGTESGIN